MDRAFGKRDRLYQLFAQEAQNILQQMQENLLELPHRPTAFKVHCLIRSAQTLKDGAAQVHLPGIETLAERLEQSFRLLQQGNIVIKPDLATLLLQAYGCLQVPLTAQVQTGQYDAVEALAKAEPIFAQLDDKLRSASTSAVEHPATVDRSANVIRLILSTEIPQALEQLEAVLASSDAYSLPDNLRTQLDVFLGFGEMLNLSEFTTISKMTLSALQTSPQTAATIGQLALTGFRAAQRAALKDIAESTSTLQGATVNPEQTTSPISLLVSPLEQARAVVTSTSSAEIAPNAKPDLQLVKAISVNALGVPEVRLKTANLLVWVTGSYAFALPSRIIEEILIPDSDQVVCSKQQRFLHWCDRMIPLYHDSTLLEVPSKRATGRDSAPNSSSDPILVLRQQQQVIALEIEIDWLIMEPELNIEMMEKSSDRPAYICGSTLWNGQLVQVVDMMVLLSQTGHFEATAIAAEEPDLTEVLRSVPVSLESRRKALLSHSLATAATVLVVDDSMTMQGMISSTLQQAGYQVVQARDGREAIAQLQQHPAIQLVISDIDMPNMNGFEFLTHRRKDPLLANVPVVIISTRGDKQYRQLASQLGAVAYFTKPYNEAELLKTIHPILEQSTPTPIRFSQ
ncbi:response regulator [Oculatella sp. LEGE 06141]|nr:response regulator [Oculatella sp. LEGE 06141]MBE9180923.1 response regulator [Oculatella sp. LEGE 06141]